MVERVGQEGVSNVTLMNQCQWSDEKIIKKQASAVLNTAKGKKGPFYCIETQCGRGKKNGAKRDRGKCGRENP